MSNFILTSSSMNKRIYNTGAAMVELALLLPLLLILFFGITEMGRALYQQGILVKTTGNATRMLSRAHLAIDTSNNCVPLANWDIAKTDATNILVYGDIDGAGQALLEGLTVTDIEIETRSLADFDKEVCIIIVKASAPFTPLVSDTLLGFPVFNLKAVSEQRYIGE